MGEQAREMLTLFSSLYGGFFALYQIQLFGVVSGSLSCAQHVPKCCGTQVLKVETNSDGCQSLSCDCERSCPTYFEPVCDDGRTLYDNWCQFGIAACKMEERFRVLKMAPLSHCPAMSFGPNHCFHFEEEDTQAHVVLHPLDDQPLTEFIIDFTLQPSRLNQDAYFISYDATGQGNEPARELLIGVKMLWVGNVELGRIGPDMSVGEFHRFTLSVKDGQILVFWDGDLYPLDNKLPGGRLPLKSGGTWILAQTQNGPTGGPGGPFVEWARFVGKICNLRMWSYGLNKDEMKDFFTYPNATKNGMVFDNPPTYEYVKKNGAY